jgi:hypothetical protein
MLERELKVRMEDGRLTFREEGEGALEGLGVAAPWHVEIVEHLELVFCCSSVRLRELFETLREETKRIDAFYLSCLAENVAPGMHSVTCFSSYQS